jgi:nicotinate-nucleotide adenylyltransferase
MMETRTTQSILLGVFGGTFDPIHVGHLILAQTALESLGLSRVLFSPASTPPHKSGPTKTPRASVEHRLRMTELALAGHERFVLSDWEGRRTVPSYTVDFLRWLIKEEGESTELVFLIGSDWTPQLSLWKEIDVIFTLCRFAVFPRPGFPRDRVATACSGLRPEWVARLEAGWMDAPQIEVSSTDIRERVAAGRSIRYRVPPSVEAYILEHGLYGAKSPASAARKPK